jgi:riboflavin kinase/FMN adenylyltransferase
MRIWNGIDSYRGQSAPVVATIGNYDGVHLGHQRILASVLQASRSRGLGSLLITFEPHPLTVVAPDKRPPLLMTRRQKLDRLEQAGLDGVLILDFDEPMALRSGAQFLDALLGSGLRLAAVHVGENFRFGRGREADVRTLREIGRTRGFQVVAIASVLVDGQPVSSSAIRRSVAEGDVGRAWQLLGRPFALTGQVVRGTGRGRELLFPTANLQVDNELIPGRGVYVTETVVLGAPHSSVTNIGVRPTFGGEDLVVETHLLEYAGELHGSRLEVRFLARLRDERRFSGASELADQIARDRAAAAAFFHNQEIRTR